MYRSQSSSTMYSGGPLRLTMPRAPFDLSDLIDEGTLSRVLPSWCSPLEDLYVYFPSRRHQSAALRAFVAFLKGRTGANR